MEFLDLKAQYKSLQKEIDGSIKKVIRDGIFIGGPHVEEFENRMAQLSGVPYALGLNSGTDALLLSLRALDIKGGDEVITTPFSFIATAEVILVLSAKPVFVDIDPDTFTIDPKQIEQKITKRTKTIIPVHLFGPMAEMDSIMKLARKYELYVIEDAAQAIGATYKEKTAGSIGDAGCFSFFPSKNLGGFGDGGMITTKHKRLSQAVRLLRNHGSSPKEKYINIALGTNSRLDALQAAILNVKIGHLKEWNAKRMERAIFYNTLLGKIACIKTPFIPSSSTHIFHQYTIRAEKRDNLKEYLKQKGIPTMIYYPLGLHLQPVFQHLGYKKGDFPEAEKASREVLSLPIYPELAKKDQSIISEHIKRFYS